jgi:hypothetical protein
MNEAKDWSGDPHTDFHLYEADATAASIANDHKRMMKQGRLDEIATSFNSVRGRRLSLKHAWMQELFEELYFDHLINDDAYNPETTGDWAGALYFFKLRRGNLSGLQKTSLICTMLVDLIERTGRAADEKSSAWERLQAQCFTEFAKELILILWHPVRDIADRIKHEISSFVRVEHNAGFLRTMSLCVIGTKNWRNFAVHNHRTLVSIAFQIQTNDDIRKFFRGWSVHVAAKDLFHLACKYPLLVDATTDLVCDAEDEFTGVAIFPPNDVTKGADPEAWRQVAQRLGLDRHELQEASVDYVFTSQVSPSLELIAACDFPWLRDSKCSDRMELNGWVLEAMRIGQIGYNAFITRLLAVLGDVCEHAFPSGVVCVVADFVRMPWDAFAKIADPKTGEPNSEAFSQRYHHRFALATDQPRPEKYQHLPKSGDPAKANSLLSPRFDDDSTDDDDDDHWG